MVFVSIVSYRYSKFVSYSLVLVLCSLVPISHALPQPYFISFTMSLYIVFAFVLLIGLAVDLFIKKMDGRYSKLIFIGLLVPLIFFYYITYERSLVWKDNVTLLEDSVVNFPSDYRARYNLGLSYEKLGLYEEALFEYEESIKLNMRFGMGYYSVARMYAMAGDYYTAIKALKWSVANGVNDLAMIVEDPAFLELIKTDGFEEVKIAIEKGAAH